MSGTYTSTLVDMLKRQSLGDVTLYDYTGRAMSSTLVRDTERDTVLQMSAASVSAVIDSPQTTHRATLSYAGREYDMAYGLLRVRGSIIGIYSVSLSSDYIGIAGQSTRLELSAFVAIAVAAVLTLGIVTSNRITAPIVRLVDAARKLSTGDLSARSAVRSDDEIGILASTFDEMAESLEDYASRLNRQYIGTVKALTTAIDARDPYTLGHSLRVGQLGRALGRELGFSEAQLTHVEVGGYLHDIGKIGVRDAVLLKTGSLTAEEREAIQGHPEIGTSILQSVELAPEVLQIVRGHHERLDGSGYPDALHGEEISLVQRVAAVADVYDALMTARPYKEAMRIEDVLEVMRREAGSLLDERVVGALLRVASAWEERVKNDPTLQGFTIGEPAPRGVRRVA
jgi:putative nucleotidyltransferase with HDIG domain